MEESPVNKKSIIGMCAFSLVVIISAVLIYSKETTVVVFCDVGQGDGIYIRTPEGKDIVIDAGPSKEILMCLGKYMPFYDRTIERLILTHPDIDHYGGFELIVDRYKVTTFFSPAIQVEKDSYERLLKKLKEKHAATENINTTDVIEIDETIKMTFIWPDTQFTATLSPEKSNEASLVSIFQHGDIDILFTGDISPEVIRKLLRKTSPSSGSDGASDHFADNLNDIEILKVPHHGSKNGLTQDFLDRINPMVSIISVGRQNRFGHPSPEVIDMFKKTGRTYFSTAERGDIVLELHKNRWRVRAAPTSGDSISGE